ncbi:MAG: hypothetical protein ACFFCS_23785 [Candidatus Hodarchaeota archaeon]
MKITNENANFDLYVKPVINKFQCPDYRFSEGIPTIKERLGKVFYRIYPDRYRRA